MLTSSLMLAAGVNVTSVSQNPGHSSAVVTLDTYSHVAPGLQEAAAARFDQSLNPRREYLPAEKVQ